MGIGTPNFFKLVHEMAVTNVMIKEYKERQLEKKIEKIVEKKLKEQKKKTVKMTKVCSKCGKSKPLNEFYKNKYNKDKLTYFCKACRKKRYLEMEEK